MNLPATLPIIDARDLSRVYPLGDSAVVGLNRISLTIAPGEMVVLKGNSGSGKSTLLSLLAGLDDPTEGRLHVAGYDLRNLSETRKNTYRRTVVGMIFQAFNLLPTMSVMENVCLPALLAGKPYPETTERWQRTVIIATHSNLADPFATLQICLKDGAITDSTCDL